MRTRTFIHSFSFRTGALLFFGVSITLVILRFLAYMQSVHMAYDDIRQIIDAHAIELNQAMARHGPDSVRDMVQTIEQEPDDANLIIYFEDKKGTKGTLSTWPKLLSIDSLQPKWVETYVPKKEENSPLHLFGRVISYPKQQARLLVAYDMWRVDNMEDTLLSGLFENIALSLLLSLLLSVLIVWLLNRHLCHINHACQQVIQGRLDHRIAAEEGGDQFNRLAIHYNQMLDWINILLETAQESGNALAHDVRTPLSRHRLELEALAHHPDMQKELQQKIMESIHRLDMLVEMFDNILIIAGAEARTESQRFEKVNIVLLLKDILELYTPFFEEKYIPLQIEIPEESVFLSGDRQLLARAIMNLADNAAKYAPPEQSVTVSLSAQSSDNGKSYILICFADHGEGIPPNYLDKVKDRFFRMEKSRHSKGAGLGLSLINAVAKLHQGELLLEDNHPGLKATIKLEMMSVSI